MPVSVAEDQLTLRYDNLFLVKRAKRVSVAMVGAAGAGQGDNIPRVCLVLLDVLQVWGEKNKKLTIELQAPHPRGKHTPHLREGHYYLGLRSPALT